MYLNHENKRLNFKWSVFCSGSRSNFHLKMFYLMCCHCLTNFPMTVGRTMFNIAENAHHTHTCLCSIWYARQRFQPKFLLCMNFNNSTHYLPAEYRCFHTQIDNNTSSREFEQENLFIRVFFPGHPIVYGIIIMRRAKH